MATTHSLASALMSDTELAHYLTSLAPSRLEALAAELADADADAEVWPPAEPLASEPPPEAVAGYALGYPL